MKRSTLALALAAGLAAAALPSQHAAADDTSCPGNSHPIYEAAGVLHCRCDDGYKKVGGACQPAQSDAPRIDADPNAGRLSRAQLQIVDGRIAALQKAVALLGEDNPEWGRERDRVLEDMHENVIGLSVEGVNLMSLGLTELAKAATQSQLAGAKADVMMKAFEGPMANLPAEEARLDRIMAATDDPALVNAIQDYTAALRRLREARYSADVAGMVARARDAAEALHSELEMVRRNPPPSGAAADGLYVSSAFLGRLGIVFLAAGEGPEAAAAGVGSAASSVLVGGRELVNLWEERGRLAALDENASARNRMRIELNERLADLQQQHDRLVWAAEHAGSEQDPR
jgi:hypothetical protein